jgi:hypothetical protein
MHCLHYIENIGCGTCPFLTLAYALLQKGVELPVLSDALITANNSLMPAGKKRFFFSVVRMGGYDDIVWPIVYLASDEAKFATGQK